MPRLHATYPHYPDKIATGLLVLGLAYASWWLQFGLTSDPIFPIDDSYITLANAVALASGQSNYSSSAVTGATSLVHLLLVRGLLPLFSPETALAASCTIGLLIYAWGLIELPKALGLSKAYGYAAAVLGCTVGLSQFHLLNGLETSLAMAGVTWCLVLALRQQRLPLYLLCGTLPWIRPDLAPLPILVLLAQKPKAGEQYWMLLLRGATVAAVASVPWLALQWWHTGQPLPGTMSAKRYYFAEDCAALRWRLQVFASGIAKFGLQIGALTLALLLAPRDRLFSIALAFIAILLAAYAVVFPGAVGHYASRYLYPLVPILLALLFAALASNIRARVVSALAVLGLIAVFGVATGLLESYRLGASTRLFTTEKLAPVANWINVHTPADAMVLVHDAGYVGYAAHRSLRDFVGLKTPELIEVHKTITHPSCGRGRSKALAAVVQSIRPDYLVVLNTWDRIFGITHGMRASGIRLEQMYDHPDGYAIYRVSNPPQAGARATDA